MLVRVTKLMLVRVTKLDQVADLIRRERSGGVSTREIILMLKQDELQIAERMISKRGLIALRFLPAEQADFIGVVIHKP